MENRRIKINNIDAVLFMLKDAKPSLQQVLKWKDVQIHILNRGDPLSDNLLTEFKKDGGRFCITPITEPSDKKRMSARIRKVLIDEDIIAKRAIIFSDDPVMIMAAKRKGVFLLAGITCGNKRRRALYDAGANFVTADIDNIDVFTGKKDAKPDFSQDLPGLFENGKHFSSRLREKEPVFFFDYDGTLSPIVSDPEKATMSEKRRLLLYKLAERHKVAIVSGRDRSDIQKFINLDNVIYAGSHGFRISGPGGMHKEIEEANKLLPRLDKIEKQLTRELAEETEGVTIERKRYAIAIHYRNAASGIYRVINEKINTLLANEPDFKKGRGKKLLEIKPKLDWHKGKALEWIMNKLNLPYPDEYIPIYIGDDITDEDAFRTMADDGIGILVGSHSAFSAATYHLNSVKDVDRFLEQLITPSKEPIEV